MEKILIKVELNGQREKLFDRCMNIQDKVGLLSGVVMGPNILTHEDFTSHLEMSDKIIKELQKWRDDVRDYLLNSEISASEAEEFKKVLDDYYKDVLENHQ